MPRVIHFEIPTADPERSLSFYGDIFGWTFTKWDGPQEYWLVTRGPDGTQGINGGLMRRPQGPGAGTVNTAEVSSVDQFTAKIEANGGKVVVPKMPIPGVGWLAYCQDPDGNVFGIMHNDRAAK